MSENTKHDFKSIGHQTLADLVASSGKIERAAKLAGHTGEIPKAVVQSKQEKEVAAAVKKNGNPATLPNGQGQRGRIFLFRPTGERVTVTKEKVGKSYGGDWIHEVVARDGKEFLASMKQLIDPA